MVYLVLNLFVDGVLDMVRIDADDMNCLMQQTKELLYELSANHTNVKLDYVTSNTIRREHFNAWCLANC